MMKCLSMKITGSHYAALLVGRLHISLQVELSKQIEKHDKVEDLDVEEVAAVAAGQDGDRAMRNDNHKLHQLDDGDERLHAHSYLLDALALERAEEIV